MSSPLKSSFYMIITFSLTINAEILEGPSSSVVFRGVNSTFSCCGTGSIFWYIDGTVYDFISSDSFSQRGFLFDETKSQDKSVSSIVTIRTMSVSNNNTELMCAVLGPNGVSEVSEKVNLTVLDLSTPVLVLSETEFEVTWNKVYTPAGHEIQTYDISIMDENGQTLIQKSIPANSENETYSYSYLSGRSLSEYPICSRLVFSVVAIRNDLRRSQSVIWERVKDLDVITGDSCMLQLDSDSVQVRFNRPQLCLFQNVYYNISLTLQGRNTEVVVDSVTGTFSGSGNDNDKIVETTFTGITLDVDKDYNALIEVQVDQKTPSRVSSTSCISNKLIGPEGLSGSQSSQSDELTHSQVIVLSVFVVVAGLMAVINGVALVCVIFKLKK